MAHLRKRFLDQLFSEARQFSPIVGVLGHRQVGKTTFLEQNTNHYQTFDNPTTFNLAMQDSVQFLSHLKTPVVIDEAQLVPSLFPALKEAVRKNQRPNQYILSGSVRFSSRKTIRESLTGRITLLEMFPMSIPELEGTPAKEFVSSLTSRNLESQLKNLSYDPNGKKKWEKYLEKGGLPGLCFLRKESWFYSKMETQISTILDRDLRMIYPTTLDLSTLRSFYETLSLFYGKSLEIAELSRLSGVSQITCKKLISAFEALYLIRFLPIHGDRKKRVLLFEDVGEARHLHRGQIANEYTYLGGLYNNLRVEFLYSAGPMTYFSQYKKRSGVYIPLIAKRGPQTWGFFFSSTENPTPKTLASVQIFLKENPNSVALILHNEKKINLINLKTAVLPLGCLF